MIDFDQANRPLDIGCSCLDIRFLRTSQRGAQVPLYVFCTVKQRPV